MTDGSCAEDGPVSLNRAHAQPQRVRDLGVRVSKGHASQHLKFVMRKAAERIVEPLGFGDDVPTHFRVEVSVPNGGCSDCIDQFGFGGLFQDEAACPCAR